MNPVRNPLAVVAVAIISTASLAKLGFEWPQLLAILSVHLHVGFGLRQVHSAIGQLGKRLELTEQRLTAIEETSPVVQKPVVFREVTAR